VDAVALGRCAGPALVRRHVGGSDRHTAAQRSPWSERSYLRTGERFIRRLLAERRMANVRLGKYDRLKQSVQNGLIEAGD
jgi:hypothetical protein